jgi:glutaredoxin-like YruB-family protein
MKVKVYSTSTCPYCDMAKEFFKKKRIPFQEIDATIHKNAEKMIKKSGQMAVPVIEIDGNIIVGFDVPRITAILKKKFK